MKMIRRFLITFVLFLTVAVLAAFVIVLVRRFNKPAPAPVARPEETIQVLEGWTSRDIGQYFERLGKWQSE
jgi:cell division protein YceG involved in septum cleavage